MLADPTMAKAHRPVWCVACEHEGLWHHHGHRDRRCQRGAEALCLVVYRFRCPCCRATATALPDELLPGIDLDLDTIGELVLGYLDGTVTYRELARRVLGLAKPVATSAWTLPVTPAPSATTCFRLVARFVAGARAWWAMATAALQKHGDPVPPPAPLPLGLKARSDDKRRALQDGWQAIHALRLLAEQLGVAISRWPFVMRHATVPPFGLDRTGWFVRPPPPPRQRRGDR